ncbi:MAG TPA: DUF6483 family protein [Ktedonobacteraceae bacterium]|jgi:hypothetical protein
MAQRDYILRLFEEASRAIAQILSHQQVKNYQAAHELIDEQIRQLLGMSGSFLLALADETLLSLLTTLGTLNAEKSWLIATLLKVDGDLYAQEQDESRSYHCWLKACNLFLEVLYAQRPQREFAPVAELEEIREKLSEYELPLRTRQVFFWYLERAGCYGQAEQVLFELLDEDDNALRSQIREQGEAFYARLLGKNAVALQAGNFSTARIHEGLTRLHTQPL